MRRSGERRRADGRIAVIAAICVAASGIAQPLPGDALPRRAALGVALAVDDSGAVVVSAVSDASAAAEAGLLPGDVVVTLDDTPIVAMPQVQSIVAAHRGGDRLEIEVIRGAERQRLVASLQPLGFERLAEATFTYGHVTLGDGVRLRTIVSVPARLEAPAPAVLFLQGGSCGSIDVPMAGSSGPNALVHAVATHGFATMRVDKPGAGDSEGAPCREIGYDDELAGYRAALDALASNPVVDSARIFIVGMSLGGFFAPIVAQDVDLAGISVYGTIAFAPTPYPGRGERFFREIANVDILAAWASVDAPVQALHGTYDEVTTTGDHAKIAAIVNQRHPGYAEHRELDRLDHGGMRHATLEESRQNPGGGEFVTDVSDAMLEFLRANI